MKLEIRNLKLKIPALSGRGFTLIELVVVFAAVGIITSLGLASLASYGNKQTIETAALDVADIFNLARSRSLSQVKPTVCGNNILTGYQVDITIAANQYAISAVCGSAYQIDSKKLPQNVSFASSSTTTVIFPLLSGRPSSSSQVVITGYGATKTINVNTTGNVSVE